MKKIVCEMCEGTEFAKVEGMFVCQNCGTKYSPEEAKSMMVEVNDEKAVVSTTTVEVIGADIVEKHLANARRAKQKEDWEEVAKYYDLVEQSAPDNMEAVFNSSYAKAKISLIDSDIYKRQAAFKVLNNTLSIVVDNFDVSKITEQSATVAEMVDDVIKMCGSEFVYTQTKDGNGNVTNSNAPETYELFRNLISEMNRVLDSVSDKIPDQNVKDKVYIYLKNIELCEVMFNYKVLPNVQIEWCQKCIKYSEIIKTIYPEYEIKDYLPILANIREEIAEHERSVKRAGIGCSIFAGVLVVAAIIVVAIAFS